VQCKHCLYKLTGAASCIRDNYILSYPACDVSQCEKVPADVLALMLRVHEQPWVVVSEEEEEGPRSGGDSKKDKRMTVGDAELHLYGISFQQN